MTSQPLPANEANAAESPIQALIHQIEKVVKGKRAQIELVLTCLFARGHVLMEDNPGTGKTVLAKTLAHTLSGYQNDEVVFKRIQFTPDLLPMDLIGAHIFDDQKKDFIFKKGPLFCNILLADEINRASPKVQSALLECMAEGQITVADTTLKLEDVFFTIATQNPIEMEGTYPLPAAQLDRFFMKIYFGYPSEDAELEIYQGYQNIHNNLQKIEQVLTLQQLMDLQNQVEQVTVHPELVKSVLNIITQTRNHPDVGLGASPRAGIAWLKSLKAFALIKGRNYVIEDDLVHLARPVLEHRMTFKTKNAQQKLIDEWMQKEMKRLSKIQLREN